MLQYILDAHRGKHPGAKDAAVQTYRRVSTIEKKKQSSSIYTHHARRAYLHSLFGFGVRVTVEQSSRVQSACYGDRAESAFTIGSFLLSRGNICYNTKFWTMNPTFDHIKDE